MLHFSCPKCQMVLQAAAEQAGATVACPRCKLQMQVPSAAPVAKIAPQPAAAPTPAAPAAAPWYFTRDGKKYGPYTAARLKEYAGSGQLLPTDLVWKEGMEGWKPASTVKGLFAAQQPPSQPAAQAHSDGSHGNPFESLTAPQTSPLAQAKKRWQGLSPKVKVGIIAGAVAVPLLLILLVCGVAGLLTWNRSSPQGGGVAQKDEGKQGVVGRNDGGKQGRKEGTKAGSKSGSDVNVSAPKYKEGFQIGYENSGKPLAQRYKQFAQGGNAKAAELQMDSIRAEDARLEKNYRNSVDAAQELVKQGVSVPKNYSENVEFNKGVLDGFRKAMLDVGGVSVP